MLLLLLLMQCININAQIPINDIAWIKDTALSDDFDGTALKTYKWDVEDSMWDTHGLGMMFKRNVIVSNGTLKIIVDTLNPARTYNGNFYYYQSGSISSKDTSFKYGYLEIRAKYPTGNIAYWPGFWVWSSNCTQMWYNEIDIAENGSVESLNGHEMGTNVHISTANCAANIHLPYTVSGLPKVDADFHKYAVQWNANNIYWYFDDNLVRYFHDADGDSIPQHYLWLVLDVYITNYVGLLPHMPKDTFEIDYFNYYTLNANCNNALKICNPDADYYNANPRRAVEKSITTGGNCSPTFSTDDKVTLRATDYILLDAGTNIEAGSDNTGEFLISVEPCPK